MQNINLDDFLTEGIIKGCSKATVPTWAYLIITANLTKYAKRIYFGEPCSAIDIFKNS